MKYHQFYITSFSIFTLISAPSAAIDKQQTTLTNTASATPLEAPVPASSGRGKLRQLQGNWLSGVENWLIYNQRDSFLCASHKNEVICEKIETPLVPGLRFSLNKENVVQLHFPCQYQVPAGSFTVFADIFAESFAKAQSALQKQFPTENRQIFAYSATPQFAATDCNQHLGPLDDEEDSDNPERPGGSGGIGGSGGKDPVCVAACLTAYDRGSAVCDLVKDLRARVACQGGVGAIYLACYFAC